MTPNNHIDFYGDETRWFIGVVLDLNDPLRLGRVKIRIYGVHSENISDIPNSDLPWAQVVIPITEGGSSGHGANTGIKEKAQVFGVFLDGKNSQLPLVLGSIPKIEIMSPEQKEQLKLEKNKKVSIQNVNDLSRNTSKNPDKDLIGGTNVEKAFNFLISDEGLSLTPIQAAGVVGNLLVESGPGDIDPTKKSGVKGENSTGIAQWNPSRAAGYRLQKLQKFASDRNYDWKSLTAQLLFMKYELSTEGYLGLKPLRQANSIDEATEIFMRKFERPAGDGHVKRRIAEARQVYKELA